VSVGGTAQTSGGNSHAFTTDVYYKVVSKNGLLTRTYQVTVEFVNDADPRPRIQSFAFTAADNAGLAASTQAMIDHDAGAVVIEAVYAADPPPYNLVPRFVAGGAVSVGGAVQTSGVSAQDFSHKVKYTVRAAGNPNLYRDYWVEVRFVKDSVSVAEISLFRFDTADNSGLCDNVTAVIDQAAGTITATVAFDSLPPGTNGGRRVLYPQWLAQGTVSVGGVVQTSGVNGLVFSQTEYRVRSADGVFQKDYTVKIVEVNTRIYVDKDAAGDNTGLSWANAFTSLWDASTASQALPAALPAEVWIAEGSYRPSETGDKAAYFKIKGNTGYYGGFAGTETAKDQRVPADPPLTTITGDLGGGVFAEHLFMNTNLGGGNAVFDGMKFTNARAVTGNATQASGPAIHVVNANSVTITDADFQDLRSGNGHGGAVYASGSIGGSVTITDCGFDTIESSHDGGAVYAYRSSSVTITGCDFTDTRTTGALGLPPDYPVVTPFGYGGAVYADAYFGDSVTISDCDFTDTRAAQRGGAVYASVSSSGSVTIRDCAFVNTQSYDSGGAVLAGSGSVMIRDCDFANTRSSSSGGAVASYGDPVTIKDCDFTDTQSYGPGGAIRVTTSATITGCNFTDTRAAGFGNSSGGAISANYNFSSYSLVVRDTTITRSSSNNSTDHAGYVLGGGGIGIEGGTAELHNVIFTDVYAGGTAPHTIGGAVLFMGTALTMTNCTIINAGSDKGGGAIGGTDTMIYTGIPSCVLSGVSFTNCSAPQGNILYGNRFYSPRAPAYTVKPGCKVNGTAITAGNLSSMASQCFLLDGSSIGFSP
jgi:hypothetical protein